MSSVPQGNRYAPPVAHVEDMSVDGDVELASRGARFAAIIVDFIVMAIIGWGASMLFMGRSAEMLASGALTPLRFFAYQMLMWVVVMLGVNGFPLATRGQTVGKLMLGIRIVRTDGSRAGFGRLVLLRYFVNNLIFMIPLLGLLYFLADSLCIFRESRQCLHDNLADTIVVKA